jgi:hypothetical protein
MSKFVTSIIIRLVAVMTLGLLIRPVVNIVTHVSTSPSLFGRYSASYFLLMIACLVGITPIMLGLGWICLQSTLIVQRIEDSIKRLPLNRLIMLLMVVWLVGWGIGYVSTLLLAVEIRGSSTIGTVAFLLAIILSIPIIRVINDSPPRPVLQEAETRANNPSKIILILNIILICIAGVYVLSFLFVALSRMSYPFDLEWTEGGALIQTQRLLSDQPLYVRPSVDYVPYVYPPLYFYLAAGVSSIVGFSFFALRLVSFTATLGCYLVIFFFVKKETSSSLAGIVGLGLFAAMYYLVGTFFDIGRVDMVALVFFMLAAYLVRFHFSPIGAVFTGLLITLSFQTKQSAVPMFMPLLVYAYLSNKKATLILIGIVLAAMIVSIAYLNRTTDGWYGFYTTELLSHQSLREDMIPKFFSQDIFSRLPLIGFLGVFFFLYQQPSTSDKWKSKLFIFSLIMGTLGWAWLQLIHQGAYVNIFIPVYFSFAILFGLVFHEFRLLVKTADTKQASIIYTSFSLIFALQLVSLWYDPISQIPTKEDYTAGESVLHTIRASKGDVLLPDHPYLLVMAGKKPTAHTPAVRIVMRIDDISVCSECQQLLEDYQDAIYNGRYSMAILDRRFDPTDDGLYVFLPDDFTDYYLPAEPLAFEDSEVFNSVTGLKSRPEHVFERVER